MVSFSCRRALVASLCFIPLGRGAILVNQTELALNATGEKHSLTALPLERSVLSDPTASTDVLVGRLPSDHFRLPEATTAKRQTTPDESYDLFYSRYNVSIASNDRLYAIPVLADDLRHLLTHAVEVGSTLNDEDFRLGFDVSAGNLTLVMTALDSTAEQPTFSWQAYVSVAKLLLSGSPLGTVGDTVKGWVGVVRGPSRKNVALVAILPRIVVADGPSTAPPRAAPPSVAAPTPSSRAQGGGRDGDLKLMRRNLYPVPETGLQMSVLPGRVRLSALTLYSLASAAMDSVLTQRPRKEYGALFLAYWLGQHWEDNVFHFRVVGGVRVSASDMRAIMGVIQQVVIEYILTQTLPSRSETTGHAIRNLRGQIANLAGTVIAHFVIGGPEGQLGDMSTTHFACAQVGVEQPDGGIAYGCMVPDS
ncbi:MAG: hypothetical protein M1817_004129 [Caeruleum heppii]|nr:MAG: hypothetical protein M1817_004129 [Caeruleum heppii]